MVGPCLEEVPISLEIGMMAINGYIMIIFVLI
jgi:hypothetical protein